MEKPGCPLAECGWPEQAAFRHDRHEQLTVAVLVEQHGDLVAVVPLHRALAPALAHDACAHGERDLSRPNLSRPNLSGRGIDGPEVVVAVPAGAAVVLAEVGQQ